MKKLLYVIAAVALFSCQTQSENTEMQTENPFYQEWQTPYGVPPFDQIKDEHYMQAFEDGMAQQLEEVNAIASNEEEPTFENTITAFEKSGDLLNKVSNVFFNLTSAHTNDSLQGISRVISPRLSAHSDNIFLNADFYARVKALFDQREELDLTIEQAKLLDNYNTRFVRAGAALSVEEQAKMRELNGQLSSLSVAFGENVLAETNKFEMVLEEGDLEGLPESVINAGAEAAKERGYKGKYVFTTHRPSLYPFITYSTNRELREKLKKGYINRGDNDDENDNKELARQLANVRLEKAQLLGYSTWADYVLTQRMLDTPDKVYNLLDKVWPAALEAAKKERDLMKEMAAKEGVDIDIMPWDWWYYAEKIKKEQYDLDENEIRPYLKVDNVINGTFILANKLFGMTFEEQTNIPKYHDDVRTYTVKNENGELIGIYLSDWFYRSSKRGGAWMNTYRSQSNMEGNKIIPIVTNVGNFTKPTGDTPSLLSQSEATTLFHEFGHALHGLLSECTYPSISGTSTPRDFVEFPSQVMENWVFEPEMLALYAFHYETGEVMPTELVEKIKNAGQFNQGFGTVEYMAASYLDMAYHTVTEPITIGAGEFEEAAMDEIGMIDAIVPRYRTGYFSHAFSNPEGYSAGYYSYLNSEVMDADAFGAFKENGLFDKETANAYREHILSKGGTRDAMEMYVNFRGREPKFEGLLERRGFN
ncbi:peptidyl-dipeptidase Dcp Metallo peptidase. MEROPS family M03A [Ekhidna lutea]|uniref:Peptidyl-dipeptidase Dcp Metallo peptidase. MEROPS family M03A n=2 Tax=Ekhidna lutea TaxID=447679 RepID=A0A239IYJ1_EKHLU|nr:peptidyl-dipeptidase Dcp Metallo peptidase. MEROPS family M03A [Ekhidna lutea]